MARITFLSILLYFATVHYFPCCIMRNRALSKPVRLRHSPFSYPLMPCFALKRPSLFLVAFHANCHVWNIRNNKLQSFSYFHMAGIAFKTLVYMYLVRENQIFNSTYLFSDFYFFILPRMTYQAFLRRLFFIYIMALAALLMSRNTRFYSVICNLMACIAGDI